MLGLEFCQGHCLPLRGLVLMPLDHCPSSGYSLPLVGLGVFFTFPVASAFQISTKKKNKQQTNKISGQRSKTVDISTQLALTKTFGANVCRHSKKYIDKCSIISISIEKSKTNWNSSVCLYNYLALYPILIQSSSYLSPNLTPVYKNPITLHISWFHSLLFHNIYSIQWQIKVHQFFSLHQSPTEFRRVSFHKFVINFWYPLININIYRLIFINQISCLYRWVEKVINKYW